MTSRCALAARCILQEYFYFTKTIFVFKIPTCFNSESLSSDEKVQQCKRAVVKTFIILNSVKDICLLQAPLTIISYYCINSHIN